MNCALHQRKEIWQNLLGSFHQISFLLAANRRIKENAKTSRTHLQVTFELLVVGDDVLSLLAHELLLLQTVFQAAQFLQSKTVFLPFM